MLAFKRSTRKYHLIRFDSLPGRGTLHVGQLLLKVIPSFTYAFTLLTFLSLFLCALLRRIFLFYWTHRSIRQHIAISRKMSIRRHSCFQARGNEVGKYSGVVLTLIIARLYD